MTIGLKAANAGKSLLEDQQLDTVATYYSEIEDVDLTEGSANDRVTPCVICYSTTIEEYPFGTLISNLNLHFKIVASADDLSPAEFDAMFEEVHDAINTSSICSNLSTVQSGFHCFGLWSEIKESDLITEGRNRVKELIVPINCCPYDVS